MEESFRVRVDKTFGSLASAAASSSSSSTSTTPSLSPSLSSLWSITDEELERREWNRERANAENTEPKPYPPNIDGFFGNNREKLPCRIETRDFDQELEADLQDLDDGIDNGDEGKIRELVKPDDHNEEEWEIRSSIGLDCTLDYEEEEDKYDKVAVSMEKADDRLYMRDITGYWTDINFYNELPNTFKDASRDPRANHMAAKLRLKEDAEAAGEFDSLQVSDTGLLIPNTPKSTLEESVNLKSILKRKENQTDPKTQKRVRFGPGYKHNNEEEDYEGTKDVVMDNRSMQDTNSKSSFPSQDGYAVPDYIQNPSKYTHYTFDSSSDNDEESNQKAYMDFLNQRKSPDSIEQQPVQTSGDLPKSITFTSKKKLGDDLVLTNSDKSRQNPRDVCKKFVPKKGGPVAIAAEEVQESEVCEMEEDEPVMVATKNSSLRRQGRQYRGNAGRDE